MGSKTPPGRLLTHANAIFRVTDPVAQQGQHLDWMISELNSQLTLSPANDISPNSLRRKTHRLGS